MVQISWFFRTQINSCARICRSHHHALPLTMWSERVEVLCVLSLFLCMMASFSLMGFAGAVYNVRPPPHFFYQCKECSTHTTTSVFVLPHSTLSLSLFISFPTCPVWCPSFCPLTPPPPTAHSRRPRHHRRQPQQGSHGLLFHPVGRHVSPV